MENPISLAEDKVKSLIINILSNEWPLTAKKIYSRVKSEGKNVSYQAVFKALQQLVAKSVVEKKEMDYSLDKTWLEKTANFYGEVSKTYSGEHADISSQILKSFHLTLKYKTMYQTWMAALNSINKLSFLTKQDNYTGFATCDHLPWAFALGDKDHAKLIEVFKKIKKMYVVYGYKNAANTLLAKYYHSLNKNAHFIFVKGCADGGGIVVGGNYLSQTIVDPRFVKSLDRIYSKLRKFDNVTLNTFCNDLFTKKVDITILITRNPELAKVQKKRILSYFR